MGSEGSKGSGFRVQGCGGGFAANIYGAMPESLLIAGFPFGFPVIDYLNANEKDFSLALEMTMRGLMSPSLLVS